MLISTLQPHDYIVANRENPQYTCFKELLGGEEPVFCFPARTADEFCFRATIATASAPHRVLFLDTDDFIRFDSVTWNRIKHLDRSSDTFKDGFRRMFKDVDERFAEYVIPDGMLWDGVIEEAGLDFMIYGEDFDIVPFNKNPEDSPSSK